MKLPELKKQFKNKYAIRIIAGVLVVALVGTGTSAYTVSAAKNETVAESTDSAAGTEEADAEKEEQKSELFSDMLDGGLRVSDREVGKEETVYVIADSTGAAKSIIV